MNERLIIKETIKKYGTSVNEVANRMGITRITLSTHINGNPSVEILLRIADAIGCNVQELFSPPSSPQPGFLALIKDDTGCTVCNTFPELERYVRDRQVGCK